MTEQTTTIVVSCLVFYAIMATGKIFELIKEKKEMEIFFSKVGESLAIRLDNIIEEADKREKETHETYENK